MRPGLQHHGVPAVHRTGIVLLGMALHCAALCALPAGARATPTFRASGAVYPTAAEPADIASGDLNADGKLDLVAANRTSLSLSVLLAGAAGGFQPQAELPTNIRVDFVRLTDGDHDGTTDVLAAGSRHLMFFRGHGDGGFDPGRYSYTGISASAFEIADLDQDGWQDALLGDAELPNVMLFWGRANVTYDTPNIEPVAGLCGRRP